MSDVIKKTITFKGEKLGESYTFTLAIVPPDPDPFKTLKPVAWKVFQLSNEGSAEVVWTNDLAACRSTVDKSTAPAPSVTAIEYHPITVKETSDLLLDTTRRPPIYHFSESAPFSSPERARIVNRTGKLVESIGSGFITDNGESTEELNLVLASGWVPDGKEVYVDHTPVAKLWVNLDHKQSQLLEKTVLDIPPVWEQNLLAISDSHLTVTIAPDASGKIVVKNPAEDLNRRQPGPDARFKLPTDAHDLSLTSSSVSVIPTPSLPLHPYPAIYMATLAFSAPVLVADGLKAITKRLASSNLGLHGFNSTLKASGTEARLEMRLPSHATFSDAEGVTAHAIRYLPDMYSRTYVKGHAGFVLISGEDGHQQWMDVNPASAMWAGSRLSSIGSSLADFVFSINGTHSAFPRAGERPAPDVPTLDLVHVGGGPEPSTQVAEYFTTLCAIQKLPPSLPGPGTQCNGGDGNNNAGQSNRGSGSAGQRNGGNGNDNAGQSNRGGGPYYGQYNGGNGNGNGSQSNARGSAVDGQINPGQPNPTFGGGPFRGQYNGGNGNGNSGQSNYGASGGQHNGGNGNGNGGQWNSGGGPGPGSQWNGGNGNNNGGQWNSGGSPFGQYDGGNGNGNARQSNSGGGAGGQYNGGNGNGNGARLNVGVGGDGQHNGGNRNGNGAQENVA
ncbi:hypothetical protein BV20DRAFT_1054157 [Pilatotrama ljubarskyi]|nr:hypothetical protein BV20DRAFT_1054157 [Pilatotrama ljubarskyi]